MTATQFNRGYWYAVELKAFAKTIGIPSAGSLRKDELEQAIMTYRDLVEEYIRLSQTAEEAPGRP